MGCKCGRQEETGEGTKGGGRSECIETRGGEAGVGVGGGGKTGVRLGN